MSSTTASPPGPPQGPPGPPSGPPAGVSGEFAGLVALVDATGRADGPHQLVAATIAAQRVINHLNGRLVRLVQALHGSYRDQLLSHVLDADELTELTAPDGGLDLSRPDLFEILDAESTVEALNDAHTVAIRMTSLEIAAALGCSRREAAAMVRHHLSWGSSTSALVDAMSSGDLEVDKAAVIAASTSVLDNQPTAPVPDGNGNGNGGHDNIDRTDGRPDNGQADSSPSPDPAAHGEAADGSAPGSGDGSVSGPSAVQVAVPVRDAVVAEVLEQVTGKSRRQVAQLTDTLVLRRDPDAAEKRHRREVRDRRLEIIPGLECTASLRVIGAPVDLAVAAYNRIDALARRSKAAADPRTLDQLRGDLALSLMSGTARFQPTTPQPTTPQPARSKTADPQLAVLRQPNATHRPQQQSARQRTTAGHPVQPAPGDEALFASNTQRAAGYQPTGQARPASVGCECLPGRPCRCECATSYADPDELATLQRWFDTTRTSGGTSTGGTSAGTAVDTAVPADNAMLPDLATLPDPAPGTDTYAPTDPVSGPRTTAEDASAYPAEVSPVEMFPLVPVAPGEVPGRAASLPDTILTVPLETVLSWIADDSGIPRQSAASRSSRPAMGDAGTRTHAENPEPVHHPGPMPDASKASSAIRSSLPPAWIERAGPLTEEIARRVLTARLTRAEHQHTGEFRIAITNKQGRLVQYHALHTRTLRGLLREAVAIDHGTCIFPTCTTHALRCQADHARDYATVRTTRIVNIEPLCGTDHSVKTQHGYRVERTNPQHPDSPASWQLAMRSGHRYPLTIAGTQLPTGTTTAGTGTAATGTGMAGTTAAGPTAPTPPTAKPSNDNDDPPPF